jgi:hypothetical protein
MSSQVTGLRVAGTLFGVVAIIHLLRLFTRIDIRIGSWEMPLWLNIVGLLVAAGLCAWLWILSNPRP